MSELPLEKRLEAFQSLSNKVSTLISNWKANPEGEPDPILKTVKDQVNINPWFTEEQVIRSIAEWVNLLNKENLENWTKDLSPTTGGKIVALIPAGNLPLVGFHDVLSVLVSGHSLLLRPSTDDPDLIPLFLLMLQQIEPAFNERIRIADGQLSSFDAVIATGSNNSARYFDYYFGKYPHIIRKNRTSVAVLTGEESEQEIQGLADDVMAYFGLGCRSVTKVYVPKGYDLDIIFKALYEYRHYLNCKPYADNYDYHRSLWMMNNIEFLENGFMLLREESSIHSPVSALHYEYYDDISKVSEQLKSQQEEIQLVISKPERIFERQALPGQGQQPALDDYADGVNTLDFLRSL